MATFNERSGDVSPTTLGIPGGAAYFNIVNDGSP